MTAAARATLTRLSFMLIVAVPAFLTAACVQAAAPVQARVLHVVDGAVLDVLNGQKRMRVRLAEIEVPDASPAHKQRSRQSLIQICGGELAQIHATGIDREGGTFARVICNRTDAGAEQVRRGMARLSDRDAGPRSALYAVQEEARSAHRGLWAEASP